jgi:hypothetical protein
MLIHSLGTCDASCRDAFFACYQEFLFCCLLRRNLQELDLQESEVDDRGGYWLSCFPESCVSLVSLNFACLQSEVNFDALERLVARCISLRSLKLNKTLSLEQLLRLLVIAPQLMELGTGSFFQEFSWQQFADLGKAFNNCKELRTLSGMWEVAPLYLPALYSVCSNLTFLNLSYANIRSLELACLVFNCHHLRRLWVRTYFPLLLWKSYFLIIYILKDCLLISLYLCYLCACYFQTCLHCW